MSEEMISRRFQLSSFLIIILGFAGVILLGALLLMLPISTILGCITPFNEALFTSTSAVCVTGLVIHDTGCYWSAFGQTIILTLIQIGGLGVVTVAALFALLSRRKISMMQRTTMQDAISAPNVGGIVRLTKFILWGTFTIELIGHLPCCQCSAATMDGMVFGWQSFILFLPFAMQALIFWEPHTICIHL